MGRVLACSAILFHVYNTDSSALGFKADGKIVFLRFWSRNEEKARFHWGNRVLDRHKYSIYSAVQGFGNRKNWVSDRCFCEKNSFVVQIHWRFAFPGVSASVSIGQVLSWNKKRQENSGSGHGGFSAAQKAK